MPSPYGFFKKKKQCCNSIISEAIIVELPCIAVAAVVDGTSSTVLVSL